MSKHKTLDSASNYGAYILSHVDINYRFKATQKTKVFKMSVFQIPSASEVSLDSNDAVGRPSFAFFESKLNF